MPLPATRRHPTVPSARVSGHADIPALASLKASSSHLAPSDALSGGTGVPLQVSTASSGMGSPAFDLAAALHAFIPEDGTDVSSLPVNDSKASKADVLIFAMSHFFVLAGAAYSCS